MHISPFPSQQQEAPGPGFRLNRDTHFTLTIGSGDRDIAAWCTMLEREHRNLSKWVQGLFCAAALGESLPAGTIASDFSDVPAPTLDAAGHLLCGPDVRGPNREFLPGSTLRLSMQEIADLPLLEELRRNSIPPEVFAKALIRTNLTLGGHAVPPREEDVNRILSALLVHIFTAHSSLFAAQTDAAPDTVSRAGGRAGEQASAADRSPAPAGDGAVLPAPDASSHTGTPAPSPAGNMKNPLLQWV